MSTSDKPINELVPISIAREAGHEEFESIERFQALEPGHYWTAQKDGGKYAPAGETLLLLDVNEFEGQVHSVKLRIHPRFGSYAKSFEMLVHDFLDVFLPNPDGEKVRDAEQQAVITQVAEMQSHLSRTASNPQLLLEAVKDEIEEGLKELERAEEREVAEVAKKTGEKGRNLAKTHRRAARRSAAKGNPLVVPKISMANDVGGLIDGGINEEGVAELSKMAKRQGVIATAQANWMTSQTKAIGETLSALTPYIEERSAVAIARTAGAVKMVERIKKGIESLDLYTGRGVDVFDIKTGLPALSSEPLTIVQGKRYAEEEFAVWADVRENFDWTDKKQFFEALAADDNLLNQVFPAQRCVVSMAMTRRERDYGDPLANLLNNMENGLVFLLVRNGENVHVVYSSSPSHEGARRLFPTRNELEQPFTGIDGKRLSIRDVEFGGAVKDFENIALLYKRFLILLCGLDHRLKLLGDFYPAEKAMLFMTAEFQSTYFRFLADEDPQWVLDDALPPLSTWWQDKNTQLQSGSRVFMLKSGGMSKATPEIQRRHHLEALPDQFLSPFTAQKEAGELFVSLDVHDRYSERSRRESAKCYLNPASNDGYEGAWWLCVDGVSAEEVSRYRHSRRNRGMGVAYLRLFRRLEEYLAAEAEAEKESRAYLLQAAVEFGGMTQEQAQSGLGNAVRNWRASRRGAPLPTVDDKAALNDILSLMVPAGHMTPEMRAMVDQYLAASGVTPLLLTRSGKSKLMLYVVANEEDRKPYPTVLTWGWVKRITLEPGKTKLKEGASTLVWLSTVLPASEVEVRRWSGLDAWMNKKEEPITLRKYGTIPALLDASKEWEPVLRAGPGAGIPDDLFSRVFNQVLHLNAMNRSSAMLDVSLAIPVAAYSKDGRTLKVVYFRAYSSSVLWGYGNEEQRKRVAARLSRSRSQKEKLCLPEWQLITSTSDRFWPHDKPLAEYITPSDWQPSWARRSVQQNYKLSSGSERKHFRRGNKGEPCLQDCNVDLSFDRAFGQLLGTDLRMLLADHHKALVEKFKRDERWAWGREEGMTDEEVAAEKKAKRVAILSTPYEHKFKAQASPLIWSSEKGRPQANALFTAPLRATKSTE